MLLGQAGDEAAESVELVLYTARLSRLSRFGTVTRPAQSELSTVRLVVSWALFQDDVDDRRAGHSWSMNWPDTPLQHGLLYCAGLRYRLFRTNYNGKVTISMVNGQFKPLPIASGPLFEIYSHDQP